MKAKAEVREATRSASIFDSALMISSVMPSLKYSFSASALMFRNGSTAIEAREESDEVALAGAAPERREGAPDGSRSSVPSAALASSNIPRTNARSLADWNRSSRFFSRHRATMPVRAAGAAPRRASAGGSSRRMAAMLSTSVSARNGGEPKTSSYRTAPKEKMSVR